MKQLHHQFLSKMPCDMLSRLDFNGVFGTVEVPTENDSGQAFDWLKNHGHREPSQRIKAALKSVAETQNLQIILQNYINGIRIDVEHLNIIDIDKLRMIKDYYLFPITYLNLNGNDLMLFERSLNSILKSKINYDPQLNPQTSEFLSSIGWSTNESMKLDYESGLKRKVGSYSRVWNRSVLSDLDRNYLSDLELSNLRIQEIFDIVINYPSSIDALYDLKSCIQPLQRAKLVSAFTSACTERLLHAGTNTEEIVLCYTSTIKSFLIIDPRGVLLDNASRPLKKYLKEREDTIPCIVHALLDDVDENPLSILSDELSKQETKVVNNLTLTWIPDPIDASPDFRKQDIVESLISIFDSKELFISELIDIFSKKLLSRKSYDITDIYNKFDLLRWKFEENDLINLEVMLRDIQESETLNGEIHKKNPQLTQNLQISVLSHMYWPEFTTSESKFELPRGINSQLVSFTETYEEIKGGRKLNFVDSGVVSLDLNFQDRTISFDVSPSKAAVISSFDGVESLSIADLIKALGMELSLIQEALTFWVNSGALLQLDNGRYSPAETLAETVAI